MKNWGGGGSRGGRVGGSGWMNKELKFFCEN